MNDIRIFALGGLDENGKNMTCVEFDDKIFIVDCGIKRPEASQYGVDYLIPDFSYVKANIDRVQAVLITHCHDDMMYAVPHLLEKANVPVYAPRFAKLMLEQLLEKHRIYHVVVHELPRYGEIEIGGVRVSCFGLTSSVPESIGVSIQSPKGEIVFAEQFVIDFDMRDPSNSCDIGAITEISKKKVFCALVEASYADFSGFTAPRHRVAPLIRDYFEDAPGRIIVTLYQQNIFRIQEIMALASEFKRRVYIYDDELRAIGRSMAENGYYKPTDRLVMSDHEFNNDVEKVVIIISGNGANVFRKTHKIAINEDDTIEFKESDTVIIASPVVSGTEKEASAMENELYKDNLTIYKLNRKQVLSMHPAVEDIKMLLYLLKPTYFIPIMGDYRDFIAAANLAVETGMTPDKIIILDNGQVTLFENGKLKSCSTVLEEIGENIIGTQDSRDISSQVLKDRELLSSDGVISIGISLSYQTKEIIAGPDIQSRGVIYVKDSEGLIRTVAKIVCDTINEKVARGCYDNAKCRADIRERTSRYVLKETGKRPLIIPTIIEINI